MPFDVTVYARFGVDTLRLNNYMRLVSLTPLERFIENGGSLPASKRVSGTQVRLWIEGVCVPSGSVTSEVESALDSYPMLVGLLAKGSATLENSSYTRSIVNS